MAAGVPLCARTPNQPRYSRLSKPSSITVGTLGKASTRALVVTARSKSEPPRICKRKKSNGRPSLPKDLPRRRVDYDLSAHHHAAVLMPAAQAGLCNLQSRLR